MNRVAYCEISPFHDRRELTRPPQFSLEVENDPVVLWYLVGLRVEAVTSIWQSGDESSKLPGRSSGYLRLALAQAQWKHDNSRWIQALASIRSSRPGAEWQAPPLSSFVQAESLSVALAGCLFWHALQEHTQSHQTGLDVAASLMGWRTWIYLKWRRAAEWVLHRNHIEWSRTILRFSTLLNADDDPNPEGQCGNVLSGWPLTFANLAMASGMERVHARIALGSWVGDVPEAQRNLMVAYVRHAG